MGGTTSALLARTVQGFLASGSHPVRFTPTACWGMCHLPAPPSTSGGWPLRRDGSETVTAMGLPPLTLLRPPALRRRGIGRESTRWGGGPGVRRSPFVHFGLGERTITPTTRLTSDGPESVWVSGGLDHSRAADTSTFLQRLQPERAPLSGLRVRTRHALQRRLWRGQYPRAARHADAGKLTGSLGCRPCRVEAHPATPYGMNQTRAPLQCVSLTPFQ